MTKLLCDCCTIGTFVNDHFGGPDTEIGPMCVCVRVCVAKVKQ